MYAWKNEGIVEGNKPKDMVYKFMLHKTSVNIQDHFSHSS